MIKIDIDMPESCDLCPLCDNEMGFCCLSNEYRSKFGKIETDVTNRPANCPLIDADETSELNIRALKRDLPELFRPEYDGGYLTEGDR